MCESLLIVLTALPLDRVPGTPASGWGGGAWASGELLRGRAEKQPWAFGEHNAYKWHVFDDTESVLVGDDFPEATHDCRECRNDNL